MLKIPSAEKITVVRSAAVKAQPYGPPPEINRGKFLDPNSAPLPAEEICQNSSLV